MSKYRKTPIEVEAVRWTGENTSEILNFAISGPRPHFGDGFVIAGKVVLISMWGTSGNRWTAEAHVGDWIVRDIRGDLYPCTNDVFVLTYEPVDS